MSEAYADANETSPTQASPVTTARAGAFLPGRPRYAYRVMLMLMGPSLLFICPPCHAVRPQGTSQATPPHAHICLYLTSCRSSSRNPPVISAQQHCDASHPLSSFGTKTSCTIRHALADLPRSDCGGCTKRSCTIRHALAGLPRSDCGGCTKRSCTIRHALAFLPRSDCGGCTPPP